VRPQGFNPIRRHSSLFPQAVSVSCVTRVVTCFAVALILTLLLSSSKVFAQSIPAISPPAIPPLAKPTIEQLMQEQGQRSREVLGRISNTPSVVQSMPNLPTPKATDIDPADLIKHYQTLKQAPEKKDEGLLVLISLSMPKASLARLVDESARYGFPLVLRGMVNDSWKDTLSAMQSLIGNTAASVQIDPRLFTRFDVKVVPTTVVVSAATERWVAVQGDVSVGYALEKIADSNSPVKALAQMYLDRMKP
jgi:conjugal transfer pilus assembly protein TrbC